MAVTELEKNQINDMLYELDMCQDDEKKCANIILEVWNKIWEIMRSVWNYMTNICKRTRCGAGHGLEMEYTDLKQFDKRERCVKLIIKLSKKRREELDTQCQGDKSLLEKFKIQILD